ncbi:hypothetical protein [Aeromonas sp. QDB25]|uniref:hypothetical protein n=1 Tax=Aeromonas sp. QDB25 TaxID=2989832 RepID=UPI0022E34F9A|nr:hypothetical protein [Aeromonas sp. QDB25]
MKKKLIYAAVVSALLSGCGGSDDNTGDTSSYLDYLLSGALLHNSKTGRTFSKRRFRSVDLLSYRHT